MGHSQPVVDRAEVHQQMLGFADALGQVPGCLESANRGGWIFRSQRLLAEQEVGAYELRQYQTFASLPRLKPPGKQYCQCILGPSNLVIEGRQLHREIISQRHHFLALRKTREPRFRKLPGALQELVLFIQEAGICRSTLPSTDERRSRLFVVAANVVIRKA